MTFGDLVLDLPRHSVTWRGKRIDLTATEFKLLTILTASGRVQSKEQLLRDVGVTAWSIRTVDAHMRRLREKLADRKISRYRARVGYRFVETGATLDHDTLERPHTIPSLCGL